MTLDSPFAFRLSYTTIAVLGAGGNTFSAIRTAMGSKRVSTNQDPYLLSVYDPTPIEIVQTKGETDLKRCLT